MNAEWANALASFFAVLVASVSFMTSLRRARQDKTDEAIDAVVKQMQALELDVARHYATKEQIDKDISDLGERLERQLQQLAAGLEDLNRFLRRRDP